MIAQSNFDSGVPWASSEKGERMIMRTNPTLAGTARVATSHAEFPRTGFASRLPGHSVCGDGFKQPAQLLAHYVTM